MTGLQYFDVSSGIWRGVPIWTLSAMKQVADMLLPVKTSDQRLFCIQNEEKPCVQIVVTARCVCYLMWWCT